MTGDGTVLGQAPLVVEEKVRARRKHRFHSPLMAVVGCVVDAGVFLAIMDYVLHHPNSGFIDSKVPIAFIEFAGCFNLLPDILSQKPYESIDAVRNNEVVISRTVELVARWDALADARAQITLPTTHATILRQPRKYTFNEALILWTQENWHSLTSERLYRIGNIYRALALHGEHDARKYAMELFTLYLQLHPTAEYADKVRHALEELRRLQEPTQ